MSKHLTVGARMKGNYEDRTRFYLLRRIPVILRLDGKAFHTLTRHCDKPFDEDFSDAMIKTSKVLLTAIQGAKIVYTQSDEISILITDFDTLNTEAWFDYNIQKMTSVASGIASAYFSLTFTKGNHFSDNQFSVFDCRVFNMPKEEVTNYFYWRQIDWIRNSISMLSQVYYTTKELHKKKQKDMHEMLFQKGINWAGIPDKWKNGTFLFKDIDVEVHNLIVKSNRNIIEQYIIEKEK
jgi:tRNA(His) guanylyltransferase